jgi:hypothetical protein
MGKQGEEFLIAVLVKNYQEFSKIGESHPSYLDPRFESVL